MKQMSIRLPDDIHKQLTDKAEREVRSATAIIVRLIEKWVAGEVDLEPPKGRAQGTK